MKKMIFLVAAVLSLGVSVYAEDFYRSLQDFAAPIVTSTTSLVNTVPAGTIVYENNGLGFKGLTPTGAWIALSDSSAVQTLVNASGKNKIKTFCSLN